MNAVFHGNSAELPHGTMGEEHNRFCAASFLMEFAVLENCANALCGVRADPICHGRIFATCSNRRTRAVIYYWLCEKCCESRKDGHISRQEQRLVAELHAQTETMAVLKREIERTKDEIDRMRKPKRLGGSRPL